jgi:hypothetical protein
MHVRFGLLSASTVRITPTAVAWSQWHHPLELRLDVGGSPRDGDDGR